MNVRYTHTRGRTACLVLLSLVATLNVSRTMVLCVGRDGHVAIEVAGHDHCRGTHASDSHCCPCTDIPIPVEPCAGRRASAGPAADSARPVTPLLLPQAPLVGVEDTFASALPLALTSYYTPLRSIVLQV